MKIKLNFNWKTLYSKNKFIIYIIVMMIMILVMKIVIRLLLLLLIIIMVAITIRITIIIIIIIWAFGCYSSLLVVNCWCQHCIYFLGSFSWAFTRYIHVQIFKFQHWLFSPLLQFWQKKKKHIQAKAWPMAIIHIWHFIM